MSKTVYLTFNTLGILSIFYLHHVKSHMPYTSMVFVDLMTVMMVLGLSVLVQIGIVVKRGGK